MDKPNRLGLPLSARRVSILNQPQADELYALINRYTEAHVNQSWAGTGDPIDSSDTSAALRLAELKLELFILALEHEEK